MCGIKFYYQAQWPRRYEMDRSNEGTFEGAY